MVETIYFLKPAWCRTHRAGLRPEYDFQSVIVATAFRRWFVTHEAEEIVEELLGLGKHPFGGGHELHLNLPPRDFSRFTRSLSWSLASRQAPYMLSRLRRPMRMARKPGSALA